MMKTVITITIDGEVSSRYDNDVIETIKSDIRDDLESIIEVWEIPCGKIVVTSKVLEETPR